MDKIFYVGFYGDIIAYKQNRYITPAGVNKMDYIARAMEKSGLEVTIVSPAWAKYNENIGVKFFQQRKFNLTKRIKVVLPFSLTIPLRAFNYLSSVISKIWLILFFLFYVCKEDKVVVYHSLYYSNTLIWLKKIIGFKLVLEVEEIYSIVFSMSKKWLNQEMRIIKTADSYIFSNDLMYNYLKIEKKKQIVIYGSYFQADQTLDKSIFNDSKIHVVYAGIIDMLKNGAFHAVNASEYLSDNYVLHILGFGQKQDIDKLKEKINLINSYSKCKVIFEGRKTGEEYVRFIQSCQIGLSTQRNEGEYLKFSFPSKVLSYLSLGLQVITARMDCLTKSEVNSLMHYYENDSGKSIAQAILAVKVFDRQKMIAKVKELDRKFTENLKLL